MSYLQYIYPELPLSALFLQFLHQLPFPFSFHIPSQEYVYLPIVHSEILPFTVTSKTTVASKITIFTGTFHGRFLTRVLGLPVGYCFSVGYCFLLYLLRKYLHIEAFRIGVGICKGRILLRVQTQQPKLTVSDLIAAFYVTHRYFCHFRRSQQRDKRLCTLSFRNRR